MATYGGGEPYFPFLFFVLCFFECSIPFRFTSLIGGPSSHLGPSPAVQRVIGRRLEIRSSSLQVDKDQHGDVSGGTRVSWQVNGTAAALSFCRCCGYANTSTPYCESCAIVIRYFTFGLMWISASGRGKHGPSRRACIIA